MIIKRVQIKTGPVTMRFTDVTQFYFLGIHLYVIGWQDMDFKTEKFVADKIDRIEIDMRE